MKVLIIIILIIPLDSWGKEKVTYKYKQYEKFDLGDMQIKGSIVAPGDLTVKERTRKTFSRKLFKRSKFDKEILNDIQYLR